MKNGFPKSIKSAMHNWNAFLLLFLILEFVIFGTANAKFLRIRSEERRVGKEC